MPGFENETVFCEGRGKTAGWVKEWPGGLRDGGGLPKIEVLFAMEVRIGMKDFTK